MNCKLLSRVAPAALIAASAAPAFAQQARTSTVDQGKPGTSPWPTAPVDAAVPAGSPYSTTATGVFATFDTTGAGSVDLWVTAYAGGNIYAEEQASDGSGNWQMLPLTYVSGYFSGLTRPINSAFAAGIWRAPVNGTTIRLRTLSTPAGVDAVAVVLKAAPYMVSTTYVDGSANLGVYEQGSASVAAGITLVVAQGGTSLVAKASAGNLYGYSVANTTTTAAFVAALNATAIPSGAGAAIAPVECRPLPASGVANKGYMPGPAPSFSAGIVVVVTTSCATYTPGGASFIGVLAR